MDHFKSKRILVTGANRGLGKALVEAAIARGAECVYAAARDVSSLETLARASEGRVVPLTLDLTSPESIASASSRVSALDLLINNAGVLAFGSVLEGRSEDFVRDMQVNYFGTLAVTRAFAPALISSRGGIVNVLTVVALSAMPALAGYSASKAAALSLTQASRAELAPQGVRVHAVFPGPVDTDMARDIQMPKTSPQDVARAIFEGIAAGDEDIYPDPMARQVGEQWVKAPKTVETMFANA